MKKDSNKNCGIYMWRNIWNNKCYVGQSVNLRKRRNDFLNFNLSYGGRRIDSARKCYNSPDYWEYEILEYCSPNVLNDKEKMYIYFYNTLNSNLGYNLSIGGDGAKGVPCTEETKQKLRERFKGKPLSKEHCKKISESLKGKYVGENNANYGKKMPEHVKEILIEYNQKKVKQLNKDTGEVVKIWNSIKEAVKALGGKGDLSDCCSGKRKTAYGYKWCYAEDEEPPIYKGRSNEKPILQYDKSGNFIREWQSIKNASESLNINDGSISGCCSGKQNSAGGFVWKYKNIEDMKRSTNTVCKHILQYDLDGNFISEWQSLREIYEVLNIKTDAIKRCAYGESETSNGYIWRFEDDEREVKPIIRLPNHRKAVYQINKDTGEIISDFISATEAGRKLGINHTKITNCCRGKQKTAGGFKWAYKSDIDSLDK